MPLLKSSSKKAFKKNIETEMHAGKPQKQSLAISYDIKRKNQRKMAKGGEVEQDSARTESRPMPGKAYHDEMDVKQTSMKKPPAMGDSMKQDNISYQARKGLKTTPIKHPRMVASDIVQSRLMDQEDHLQTMEPLSTQEQYSQGDKVPDMQDEHSTRRKPYAKGGEVESSDYKHPMNMHEDDLQDLGPSEDEGSEMAHMDDEMGQDRQGPEDHMEEPHSEHDEMFMDDEANEDHMEDINPARLADGGMVDDEDEEALEHHASVAAAIMAQREAKRSMALDSGSEDMDEAEAYAEGGEILSHDSIYSDDSDQADLSRNADEDANEEDQTSFNALRKENYSESEGLDQMGSPMDSNEHGDMEESDSEDDHDEDVVSQIRRNMRRRSPITR